MNEFILRALQIVWVIANSTDGSSGTEAWTFFDWLAFGANIGSLAGLFGTLYALYKTWNLKKKYDVLVRGGELARRLSNLEDELFEYLTTGPGVQHSGMKAKLKRGTTVIDNLLKKLDDSEKDELEGHLNNIQSILNTQALDVDQLWEAYSELTQVNEIADDLIRSRTLKV